MKIVLRIVADIPFPALYAPCIEVFQQGLLKIS